MGRDRSTNPFYSEIARRLSSGGGAWQNELVSKKNKEGPKRKRASSGWKIAGVFWKDGLFGFMAGKVEIVGDIQSPIEDGEHWNPAKNLEK
jgi:hypothetical protein